MREVHATEGMRAEVFVAAGTFVLLFIPHRVRGHVLGFLLLLLLAEHVTEVEELGAGERGERQEEGEELHISGRRSTVVRSGCD